MTPEQTAMYFGDSDSTLEFNSLDEALAWQRQHGK
jgi:hypothetical protein